MSTTITIPTLQTERLTLRAPMPGDIEAMSTFYMSDRSHMFGGPLEPVDTWRMFAGVIGHWHLLGYGRWTVTMRGGDDTPLGLVGLHNPEGWPEPEIGWMVYAQAEGKGIAFEASMAARRYAYEVLDWDTCISLIAPANTRSVALAERMGAAFEYDFTHARFGDMKVWRHPGPEALA
ncbi:MAG: GNAT family N-acetyltransferase [Pseudomonadota bacterium]